MGFLRLALTCPSEQILSKIFKTSGSPFGPTFVKSTGLPLGCPGQEVLVRDKDQW